MPSLLKDRRAGMDTAEYEFYLDLHRSMEQFHMVASGIIIERMVAR